MDEEREYGIRANFMEALRKFDFGTVENVMNYLDWHWWDSIHTPTKERMIKMLNEELFEQAIKDFKGSDIWISSGGFTLIITKDGVVVIQFIVEETSSAR